LLGESAISFWTPGR
ncbi:MAG: hypothetical protein EZS28_024962, partial [Streblomastix strix]